MKRRPFLALLFLATLLRAAPRPAPATAARLKKARDTYAAAVDAARKRLLAEYDSVIAAYTRASNLDAALAVRQSRDHIASTQPSLGDPETPDTEDGWTILFRSDDPLIWNLPVRNK